jgi:hypothetical protein
VNLWRGVDDDTLLYRGVRGGNLEAVPQRAAMRLGNRKATQDSNIPAREGYCPSRNGTPQSLFEGEGQWMR